ncbi:HNH endonuclease [Pandoraea sp. ISTKB]|uniref:HNH endonuclease n=1 Tax=Pandoraea sp. ISTKB TaxID=1586708 RepID=UPI0008463910|nr:HNH endonuclease signature motif containing protein [Pandoraea sp. ISTKB]ODP31105.1 hypothetical protein A9762_27260 [Pandoraea sp. ISTKB]
MNFYWVNVGVTINEVCKGHFLWAPEASQTKSGNVKHLDHWDNVASVRQGDVIFCCHNKAITHIATAREDAFKADRPASRSFVAWGVSGHQVNVALRELQTPIIRDEIATDFISHFDERCVPRVFTSNATLKQIYMARLPADAGVYLLDRANAISLFEESIFSASKGFHKIGKTTREAIVKARVGQGRFRTDLLRRWSNRCALTGLSNTDLLVASHIHAWSLCDNDDRINPDNGLLLASHIDRLFDRGHISFDDRGEMLIGETLSAADRSILALDRCTRLRSLTDGNRTFLAKHRDLNGFL